HIESNTDFHDGLLDSLRAEAVPRVRLSRYLAAQGVDRGGGGEKERLQIGAAEREIGRDLWCPDDAEQRPLRREHPGSARAGAINPAFDVDLHTVWNAISLF